nr:hypothetical protein [Tanacetum cinerariifolium]
PDGTATGGQRATARRPADHLLCAAARGVRCAAGPPTGFPGAAPGHLR